MMSTYYRPTPGRTVGHWNVFGRDGSVVFDVPFADLPEEVKEHIRRYKAGAKA